MIELRWLEKPKAQPIYDTGENVRVLQYRVFKTPNIAAHLNFIPSTLMQPEWSDWQDVPVVTEE